MGTAVERVTGKQLRAAVEMALAQLPAAATGDQAEPTSEGLSRLVGETCDQRLQIPIQGVVGSLNASVAAALGMFEWRRKQNFPSR